MTDLALLPCPFCGSTDIYTEGPCYDEFMCNDCGISQNDQNQDRAGAIAAWNRRAATSPAGDLVVDGEGWVRVRIDTDPDANGWCFVTPANHPEDIATGRVTGEWKERDQFFAQVHPAPAQSLRYQSTGVTEITDEMVERALDRWFLAEDVSDCTDEMKAEWRADMRASLAAALSAQERG